jgi:hypothetical protein
MNSRRTGVYVGTTLAASTTLITLFSEIIKFSKKKLFFKEENCEG